MSCCTPSSRSQFSGDTIPRLTGPSATGFAAEAVAAAEAAVVASAARPADWKSGSSYTDGYRPVRDEKMDGAAAAAVVDADAAAAMVTAGSNGRKESKANGTGVPSTELNLRVSVANQDEVGAGPSNIDIAIDTMAVVVVVATYERWRGGEWVVAFDMVCYVCMIVVHI